MTSLAWTSAIASALLLLGACESRMMEDAGTDDAQSECVAGISELETTLPGVADANARRVAEDELEEMYEAREDGDWDDCLDALEEAREAIE